MADFILQIPIGPAIADKSEGDFSGFSRFSVRFPGFSSLGKLLAARGTHFPAPESIFHVRESNFHAQIRFVVARNRFLSPEDGRSCVFGWFSWLGRVWVDPGIYLAAQEWIFHTQESIFHAQDSIFMPGDAWGTPGGRVLS